MVPLLSDPRLAAPTVPRLSDPRLEVLLVLPLMVPQLGIQLEVLSVEEVVAMDLLEVACQHLEEQSDLHLLEIKERSV